MGAIKKFSLPLRKNFCLHKSLISFTLTHTSILSYRATQPKGDVQTKVLGTQIASVLWRSDREPGISVNNIHFDGVYITLNPVKDETKTASLQNFKPWHEIVLVMEVLKSLFSITITINREM